MDIFVYYQKLIHLKMEVVAKKLMSISEYQSKSIKFEEFCNCLVRGEFEKKCDGYVIHSINYGMYLQKVFKNSVSA